MIRDSLPSQLALPLNAYRHYLTGEPELRLLRRLVDPTRNAVDVGAHRGVYSYFLSKLALFVFVYEPNPELTPFLISGLNSNRCEIRPIALSNHNGAATLQIPVDGTPRSGWGTIEAREWDHAQTMIVSVRKLDDEHLENVGFIKVDVEGHEDSVLSGGYSLISTQRPVILAECEERHRSSPVSDFLRAMTDLGYSISQMRQSKFHGATDSYVSGNFVMIPEGWSSQSLS